MIGFMLFIQVIICILLIIVILMQSGRGGGLNETFAAAESMFGAKTNEFMVKATTVVGTLFIISCLTLAVLSAKKNQSLMEGKSKLSVSSKKQMPSSTSQAAKKNTESVMPTTPAEGTSTAEETPGTSEAIPTQAKPATDNPVQSQPVQP